MLTQAPSNATGPLLVGRNFGLPVVAGAVVFLAGAGVAGFLAGDAGFLCVPFFDFLLVFGAQHFQCLPNCLGSRAFPFDLASLQLTLLAASTFESNQYGTQWPSNGRLPSGAGMSREYGCTLALVVGDFELTAAKARVSRMTAVQNFIIVN